MRSASHGEDTEPAADDLSTCGCAAEETHMTKEQMLKRIEEIVSRCDGHYASRIEPEHALNGALTLMIDAYGRDSHHVATRLKRRGELASTARMTDAIY